MPRPVTPYLHRRITRHGRTVWYVRRRGRPVIRIHGTYGSPEFTAAYLAALGGVATEQIPVPKAPTQARVNAGRSYVYFAECGTMVKIGVSHTPKKRLEALRAGAANSMRIVKTLGGDIALEREMHKRFAAYRVRGEWFKRVGALAAYLDGDASAQHDAMIHGEDPMHKEIIL